MTDHDPDPVIQPKEVGPMTMTTMPAGPATAARTATTAATAATAASAAAAAGVDGVQVLPLTLTAAEVRLGSGAAGVSIGKVAARNGRWYWQHRDGEQSSPIADNRTAAANALAEYHRAFKAPAPAPAQPVRRLLFG